VYGWFQRLETGAELQRTNYEVTSTGNLEPNTTWSSDQVSSSHGMRHANNAS
jgi:hypothetical protein